MRSPVPAHIIITGASAGLGLALALAHASPGVVLGLVGRDLQRIDAAATACRARGATVETGIVDVRDAVAIGTWLDAFDAR
ncbi:SDR family NAD(P)-dependent oxidoreductase, partial [Burkholderia vietnamiensis]|uniref:SDR family NAD(P)-dependent oxidoreductase n=1 Tax=Burkholderia vietnamiensis TaxID=60552 RepID=UPI001592DF0B